MTDTTPADEREALLARGVSVRKEIAEVMRLLDVTLENQRVASVLYSAAAALDLFDMQARAASQPARPVAFLGALLDEYLHAGHEAYKLGRETERVSKARRAIVAAFHASQPAQEPMPAMTLPDCMMGPSEPCKGYNHLMQLYLEQRIAAPPADDEAVRLLKEATQMDTMNKGERQALKWKIDAYLAKARQSSA